jgi:hypothetical protein
VLHQENHLEKQGSFLRLIHKTLHRSKNGTFAQILKNTTLYFPKFQMATTTLYEKKFLYKLTGDAQAKLIKSSAIYDKSLKCYPQSNARQNVGRHQLTNMQL